MFTAALFMIVKVWKQPKCPSIKEGIKNKYMYTHTHTDTHTHTLEYYTAIIKDTLPFETTWMDLEHIIVSITCQTEKYKYCTILLICGI